MVKKVITVAQAIEIIKKNQPLPKMVSIKLLDALNMVLAEEIFATIDSPPFTNSAMDGFAVFWEDISSASPTVPAPLRIIGESSAGYPCTAEVKKGEAIRISTGAIIPQKVDSVVPIEKCLVENNFVKILSAKNKGQNIRLSGEEFQKGTKVLVDGITLGSAQIGLLAFLGIDKIKVYQKPRVTIITTGSELVPFDQHAERHQLRDSNTPMLKAAVLEAGGEIIEALHVKDDALLTKQTLNEAIKNSDLIISSGGVSMGNHDHVRDMALSAGFSELFWKINQKPGKPMFLAKKEQTLLMALPGNPVSTFMCFKHYIRPLIQSLLGKSFTWPTMKAYVVEILENKLNLTQLMRVKLKHIDNKFFVSPLQKQGSHMATSIAQADGYIILAEEEKYSAGDETEVFLF